jgi:hypothetical protein
MKRLLFCLYLGVLTSQSIFGQQWSAEEVKKQLPLIYKVVNLPLGDNKYHITTTFDTLPLNHPLYKLVKNHDIYLSYLTSRYSHIDYTNIFTPEVSFAQADETFRKTLASDTLLNRCFLEMATYYLQAQGIDVKGISLTPKPAITMPTLLQTAVRFFDRIEATPNNHVAWYINLKTNPEYDQSEVGNQPLIEAFCSQAIMNWSFTPTWRQLHYEGEFYEEVKSFNARTALLTTKKDWREVVRPPIRDLMAKSKELEKVLLAEYELSKEWVGFTLVK